LPSDDPSVGLQILAATRLASFSTALSVVGKKSDAWNYAYLQVLATNCVTYRVGQNRLYRWYENTACYITPYIQYHI
jgi:hypothetical protein